MTLFLLFSHCFFVCYLLHTDNFFFLLFIEFIIVYINVRFQLYVISWLSPHNCFLSPPVPTPHPPSPVTSELLFPLSTCLFIFHIRVKSSGVCLSQSGLFHLAWFPLGPSMLLQMGWICLFFWVVFHCIYIHHIFFIQSSVDRHLDCFHVLWIVLQWMSGCTC